MADLVSVAEMLDWLADPTASQAVLTPLLDELEELAARISTLARELRAWRWGDAEQGGLLVARPLFALSRSNEPCFGESLQVLGLAWSGEVLRFAAEPETDGQGLEGAITGLGAPAERARLGGDEALDELAARLWRFARAGGALPEAVRALSHLFALPASAPLG